MDEHHNDSMDRAMDEALEGVLPRERQIQGEQLLLDWCFDEELTLQELRRRQQDLHQMLGITEDAPCDGICCRALLWKDTSEYV